jgi:hypothetical protein
VVVRPRLRRDGEVGKPRRIRFRPAVRPPAAAQSSSRSARFFKSLR